MIHMPASAATLAESLMTDTVSWTRAGAVVTPVVVDPVTGRVNSNPDVTVYSGPARRYVKRLPLVAGGGMSAGDFVVTDLTYMSLPLSAPALKVADVGTITASVERPGDVGMRYQVVGLVINTQAAAQRVHVEMVVG